MDYSNNTQTASTGLSSVVEAIRANIASIEVIKAKAADMPINEAAQILLIEKFKLTQIEAQEIVEKINKGITEYAVQRATFETNTKDSFTNRLAAATANLNEEERTRCYVNMLTAMQLVNNTTVTPNEIDAAVKANTAMSDAELVAAIETCLTDFPLESLIQNVATELDTKTLSMVSKALNMNTNDFRFAAALELFIAQKEGRLNFTETDTDSELSPEIIGSVTAAGIDTLIATVDLSEGKIDLTRWQTIVKWILGALFLAAAFFLAIIALTSVFLGIALTFMNIFGIGILSTIFTTIVMFTVIFGIGEKSSDAILWTLEKLSPIYDKLVVKVTESITNLIGQIKAWITERKNTVNQTESNIAPVTPVTTTSVTSADGEVALA